MENDRFGQFEVRRQAPLQQQLPDVPALLAAVHFLW
jgi:hypothetical protein